MRRLALTAAFVALLAAPAVAQTPGPGPLPTGTAGTKNVGVSVNDPGTGSLEALRPVQTLARTNYTFTSVDLQKLTRRSNAGAAMADTLPAVNLVGMANGAIVAVANVDATASDTLTAGFGTTVNGASTLVVPPGTSVVLTLDLPNTNWVAATSPGAGGVALLSSNNLSDVASATTSRANLSAAKSGANSDLTSITGLTTPLAVSEGGTAATTADAAHGQLNTPPTNDVTWTGVTGTPRVFDGNGNAVSTTGTTTSGLQEAINKALQPLGTQGQDLTIYGQDNSTGGAYTVPLTTTLSWPVTQGKKVDIGSVTFNTTSAIGANPGWQFDSQEMMDFSLRGAQPGYAGTGQPILFAPTNGTPLDGLKGIVDSRFYFGVANPIEFTFPTVNSFANNVGLTVQELNGDNSADFSPTNADLSVASTTASQNFCENNFRFKHMHGIATGGWGMKIGTSAPASSCFGHNYYNFHLTAGDHANANGIDTWESGSLFAGTIDGVTGANTSFKFESGACNNVLILPYNSDWTSYNDASGCTGANSNVVIGNGTVTQANIPAVFATPGQLPGTGTNDNASSGHVGEFVSSTVASGSAVALTDLTTAQVTSITLSPGDWDVTGVVAYIGGSTTTVSFVIGGIESAVSLSNTPGNEPREFYNNGVVFGSGISYVTVSPGPVRYSVSTSTTVYLVAYAHFGTSTMSAYGTIRARRVR